MPAQLIIPRSNVQRRQALGGRMVHAPKKRPKLYWVALLPAAGLAFYLHHLWLGQKSQEFSFPELKISTPPTIEVRCPQCMDDKGFPMRGRPHPDNPDLWLPCPVCFGAGQRLIMRPNASTQEVCPQCAGMGRFVQDGSVTPCEICEEWGFVETASIKHSVITPEASDPGQGREPPVEAPDPPPAAVPSPENTPRP